MCGQALSMCHCVRMLTRCPIRRPGPCGRYLWKCITCDTVKDSPIFVCNSCHIMERLADHHTESGYSSRIIVGANSKEMHSIRWERPIDVRPESRSGSTSEAVAESTCMTCRYESSGVCLRPDNCRRHHARSRRERHIPSLVQNRLASSTTAIAAPGPRIVPGRQR